MSFWYLHPAKILRDLDRSTLDQLSEAGRLKRWGHRASIPNAQDVDYVSLILKGSVDVQDLGLRLQKGDLFGTLNLELQNPLRAFDDALICEVPKADFLAITEGKLPPRQTNMRLRAKALKVDTSRLLFTEPTERIRLTMAELAETYGEKLESGHVLPPLRARHFAQLTGLSMSQTRGILNQLQDSKLVQTSRGVLIIPDLETILRVEETKL